MKHSFEKIALVARGEAAVRLIRAIRELNHERHLSLAAVALFTESDRQALFVHEADDAICIGPQQYRVTMSRQSIEVHVERLGAVERRLDPSSSLCVSKQHLKDVHYAFVSLPI